MSEIRIPRNTDPNVREWCKTALLKNRYPNAGAAAKSLSAKSWSAEAKDSARKLIEAFFSDPSAAQSPKARLLKAAKKAGRKLVGRKPKLDTYGAPTPAAGFVAVEGQLLKRGTSMHDVLLAVNACTAAMGALPQGSKGRTAWESELTKLSSVAGKEIDQLIEPDLPLAVAEKGTEEKQPVLPEYR